MDARYSARRRAAAPSRACRQARDAVRSSSFTQTSGRGRDRRARSRPDGSAADHVRVRRSPAREAGGALGARRITAPAPADARRPSRPSARSTATIRRGGWRRQNRPDGCAEVGQPRPALVFSSTVGRRRSRGQGARRPPPTRRRSVSFRGNRGTLKYGTARAGPQTTVPCGANAPVSKTTWNRWMPQPFPGGWPSAAMRAMRRAEGAHAAP